MGKPSGLLVASYLFLILSVAPVDAARVQGATNTVAKLSTQAVAEADSNWHVFATHEELCARWQTEFQQRSVQVDSLRARIASGDAGSLKTAQAVLRLRSMTRVYERAARQECTWVQERNVDASALNNTVHQSLGQNPCFPQAQALLTTQFNSQQEQIVAMLLATQFLTTRECDQAAVDRMAAELDASAPNGQEEISVDEQMAAANEDADTVTDELVENLMEENSTSLIQLSTNAQFIPVLEELVGLVAFLLIWAIMCIVFIPVILMVIGAVLCTLSWVIRRFLNSFGSSNLGSCMNWWAHQTQLMFSPGNELITAGACFLAGWFGAIPSLNIHANFPNLGIYIRR